MFSKVCGALSAPSLHLTSSDVVRCVLSVNVFMHRDVLAIVTDSANVLHSILFDKSEWFTFASVMTRRQMSIPMGVVTHPAQLLKIWSCRMQGLVRGACQAESLLLGYYLLASSPFLVIGYPSAAVVGAAANIRPS